ncbi:MAG: ribonuclease Y [Isosphaeraceae bacterium]
MSIGRGKVVPGVIEAAILGIVLGLILGASGFFLINRWRTGTGLAPALAEADRIQEAARQDAATLKKQAELEIKEEALRRREALDREAESARKEIRDQERRVEKRADLLDEKLAHIHRKEADLEVARAALEGDREGLKRQKVELDCLLEEQGRTLHRLAGLDPEQARDILFHRLDSELAGEIGGRVLKQENLAREAAACRAREILATAIQRYAAGHTAETTTSTVDIPNDEMKGRIIGREGRNIRAFEKATGVDVIVDDTPGIVIVSAFDNVRRNVAKLALEKLIQDGRIHPGRIEEIVAETREEMDRHIQAIGQSAALEANVAGLHDKLISYLGRLKFRTSYSQNVLQHSIEVAHLTGMLAQEIGLDGALGRRCGLLHDLGKAADHEMEGGHPQVGAELLKKYGEPPEVVHAAAGHHDDLRVERTYTVLVAAADAISASRPGARRDTLEKYVRRLEELEALVLGFPGIDQVYAIQAGREVRILVDSNRLSDELAAKLCREVAQEIGQQLTFPGEVKVTVLRENRFVEYAR